MSSDEMTDAEFEAYIECLVEAKLARLQGERVVDRDFIDFLSAALAGNGPGKTPTP